MSSRVVKMASLLVVLLFLGPLPTNVPLMHDGGMGRDASAEGTTRTLTKDVDLQTGPGGPAQLDGAHIWSGEVRLNTTNSTWSQDSWSNGTVHYYTYANGTIPYSVNSSVILERNGSWRQVLGPVAAGSSMIWDPYNGRPVVIDSNFYYNSEITATAYYDFTNAIWRSLPRIPGNHYHPYLFWVNRTKEIVAMDAVNYLSSESQVYAFNVTNGQWTEHPGFQANSWDIAYCWNEEAGRLLMSGGSISSSSGSVKYVGTFLYDYENDTFIRRADLPAARRASYCFWDHLHQRYIEQAGHNPSGGNLLDTLAYYPKNDTWVKLGAGPSIYGDSHVVYDPGAESCYIVTWGTQNIYAFNLTTAKYKVITNRTSYYEPSMVWDPARSRLIDFDQNYTSGMEVIISWNPRTKLWETLVEMPIFRSGYTAAYDERREIVVYTGGLSSGITGYAFWGYNVTTGQWMNFSTVSKLPASMSWHSMVYDEVGDQIILFGGTLGTAVYALQLANLTWKVLSPMPTAVPYQCPVWVPENRTIMMLTVSSAWNGNTYLIQYDVAADKWSLDNALHLNLGGAFGAWDPDGKFAMFYGGNGWSIYSADWNLNTMYYYYPHNKSLVQIHTNVGQGMWRAPPIAGAGSEWDPLGNRMLFAGGTDYDASSSDDPAYCIRSFAYYPTNNTFVRLESNSAAGYQKALDRLQWDARHNRMLLMGGDTDSNLGFTKRDVWVFEPSFKPSGVMESMTIDTGGNIKVFNLSWDAQVPSLAGKDHIRFQLAASAYNNSWDYVGPDCTSRTYYTDPGTPICREQMGMRYWRYRLLLSTENSTVSPLVSKVSIQYQQYVASGKYISPALDLIEEGVDLLKISWNDVLPPGTTIGIRVATTKLPVRSNITTWYSLSKTQSKYGFTPSRYLWFDAGLNTSDRSVTPELTDISVNFNRGITLDNWSLDRMLTTPSIPVSFMIRYTDPDNDRPYMADLVVNDMVIPMNCDDGPTSQGVYCYYNSTFPSGVYMHYYNFSDGRKSMRVPANGVLKGPLVNEPAKLQDGSIEPEMGTTEDGIGFNVRYTDLEAAFPYRKVVVVDGAEHDMNFLKGDPSTGATFTYVGRFPVGVHHYHFEFNDSMYDVRFPLTGELQGPQIEAQGAIVIKGVTQGKNVNESEMVHVSAATIPDLEASGIQVTYQWYLDGQPIGEGKSLDLAFTAGSHVLKVVGRTLNQEMEYHTAVIAVHQNKPPIAQLTISKTQFLVGDTMTVDGTGSWDPDGNITNYVISFGDGSSPVGAKGGKATHKYAKQGTYTVTLTVTDNSGKQNAIPASIKVQVQKRDERIVPGPEASWTMVVLVAVAIFLCERKKHAGKGGD
jgi:hypothetical protein